MLITLDPPFADDNGLPHIDIRCHTRDYDPAKG
jgi:hypothetical protein